MSTMRLPHHGRYGYSVIDARPDYDWPEGRRLAFTVVVSVEHFAFGAGTGEDISVIGAPQTQRNYGWRDYGQRVGLWRLLKMLDGLGIPVSLAINSLLFRTRPALVARLLARGDEIIAHARTSSELLTGMWEDDEARLIREATQAIATARGSPPAGWLSPGFGETRVTPDLVQEAGYRYLLDWPADDQPFWLGTRNGRILSVPYPLELNDVTALLHRHHSGREFGDMVANQFDEMLRLSATKPLVCALGLHPYIVGQPFRLRALRQALQHCMDRARTAPVWFTRPGEVAAWCAGLPEGTIPGP